MNSKPITAALFTLGVASQSMACDVPVKFIWISDFGLLYDSGLATGPLAEKTIATVQRNLAGSLELAKEKFAAGGISVCDAGYQFGGIDYLAKFPQLKVDAQWWGSIRSKIAAGTLPRDEKGKAQRAAKATCVRAVLSMGLIADSVRAAGPGISMRGPDGAEPAPNPNAELPVIVIVTGDTANGIGCGEFETIGWGEQVKLTINDPLTLGSSIAKHYRKYSGATMDKRDDAPKRGDHVPFAKKLRSVIHMKEPPSRDLTLAHELGHYLGLAHVTHDYDVTAELLCRDVDRAQSGVTDTPQVKLTTIDEHEELWKYVRPEDFPDAACPIKDENGTPITKEPLDNIMLQGPHMPKERPWRFTPSQFRVMKKTIELLEK